MVSVVVVTLAISLEFESIGILGGFFLYFSNWLIVNLIHFFLQFISPRSCAL